MSGQSVFLLMCAIGFVWAIWLATCRPDTYNKLSDGAVNRAGRAGKGLLKVAGMGARAYLKSRGR
jgi:hypothetical protein